MQQHNFEPPLLLYTLRMRRHGESEAGKCRSRLLLTCRSSTRPRPCVHDRSCAPVSRSARAHRCSPLCPCVPCACGPRNNTAMKTCGRGKGHDCSSHQRQLDLNAAAIVCKDQKNGCTDEECCTVMKSTLSAAHRAYVSPCVILSQLQRAPYTAELDRLGWDKRVRALLPPTCKQVTSGW